nr:EamA family transporter [Gephyromycinifex aptenodytis]
MTRYPSPSAFPVALVLGAVVSVQFGGALAATLLPVVGVAGSVSLRLIFAVVIMLAIARPRLRGYHRADWATVAAFGVALAGMNAAFYASLTRLPLGVAVTIEFIGPLVLAASTTRRVRDIIAVIVAATGVILIAEIAQVNWAQLDILGILLALLAGAFWAGYIVLSGRAGARFPRLDGLALALVVAAVLVTPFGILTAGDTLLTPEPLIRGLGIAVLSSVLPYSLELVALRRLSAQVFGILLSLEPAVAAIAGFFVLGQRLDPLQLVGMGCVVGASASVTRSAQPPPTLPDTKL